MPLYHPKYRKEAKTVKKEVMAVIVHAFLKRVQSYTEDMVKTKKEELNNAKKIKSDAAQKHSDWIRYLQFNEIALKDIEDGTLDSWFETLME